MSSSSIRAHFDGKRILLDEPIELEPNTRLLTKTCLFVVLALRYTMR